MIQEVIFLNFIVAIQTLFTQIAWFLYIFLVFHQLNSEHPENICEV